MLLNTPFVGAEQVGVQILLADVGSRLLLVSTSLAATSMATVVSSGVLELSSLATGGSLTELMEMLTVAVSQAPNVSQIS